MNTNETKQLPPSAMASPSKKNFARNKTRELTLTAMMGSIILIMSLTPLGYLRTFGLEISLITIPVAIGAMLLGKKAGLILGTLFGLTSFYQCFGASPFGTMLFGISPVGSFLMRVPTRALMGFLTGLIFEVLYKKMNGSARTYFLTGAMAALLNTILFMAVFVLFFFQTPEVAQINEGFGNLNVLGFIFAFVGINGLLEVPATSIIGGTVSRAIAKALR
ncbi:MAG: ECF transporter S component [Bacillota bacterium]